MGVNDEGTVTDLAGMRAAGIHCGIKADGVLDLALIVSDQPCSAAGVFTMNQVKAAPVVYDQAILARNAGGARAVVINSGNANAVTGEQGMADTQRTAVLTAEALGCAPDDVWVMSTGVIGQMLDMDKIGAGITKAIAALSTDGGHDAARAIMTTDTKSKEAGLQVSLSGGDVMIAGMSKGSGMIHPNMATMLSVIATDAAVPPNILDGILRYAVDRSFNCITVDGDTSTNDTVLLLANGAAGATIDDTLSADYVALRDAVTEVATALAQKIVRDGEGANKFVSIRVRGAKSAEDAKAVAKSVAHSPLVKTAMYGEDANWGRILCATGYSGVDLDPTRIGLWLAAGGSDTTELPALQLVKDGQPHHIDEEIAAKILAHTDVDLTIDLGEGKVEATVWTCDLSHDYVSINADYRT